MDTQFSIMVEDGKLIQIHFTDFDIESHDSCLYDYVLITDGNGTEILPKSCGSIKPDDVTSFTNKVRVTFYSDDSVQKSGFKLIWFEVFPGGCSQRKVRKNVNSLSSTEITRLQDAMREALASDVPWRRFQDVAHYHGSPNTGSDALCSEGRACCPHGTSQFLTWHRLLLVNMEELLGEPLPYWDWTEDENVPQIFENISVPFKNSHSVAPSSGCHGNDTSVHRRGRNICIEVQELKQMVAWAYEAETYDQFWERIQDPHNAMHWYMDCDMRWVETAAYDPVFYLHHTNVDRQFAFWQEVHRIRNSENRTDLQIPLKPFHNETVNPFNTTRKYHLGVNALDYKNHFCYEYDTLTFNGSTPEMIAGPDSIPEPDRGAFRHFVGVVLPRSGPSSMIKFSVCIKDGKCHSGGNVFTFGAKGDGSRNSYKVINSTNFYISEYEVTDLPVKDWTHAFAVVTNSQIVSPVPPIIIQKPKNGANNDSVTVFLSPKANKEEYGSLLEKFPGLRVL